MLEREVQLACTHALLTCLDREHRIAYILGEILGVDSDDGGYICNRSGSSRWTPLMMFMTSGRAFNFINAHHERCQVLLRRKLISAHSA